MIKQFFTWIAIVLLCAPLSFSTTLNGLINDIEVMYFFDKEQSIDWPLIYHLSANQGCRVEVVNISSGPTTAMSVKNANDLDVILAYGHIPGDVFSDSSYVLIDSVFKAITGIRSPDIVIMPGNKTDQDTKTIEKYIKSAADMPGLFSDIKAMYHRVNQTVRAQVFSNSVNYISQAGDEIDKMVEQLTYDKFDPSLFNGYTLYRVDDSLNSGSVSGGSFFSGIVRNKLIDYVESCIDEPTLKARLNKCAKEYEDFLKDAAGCSYESRIENMISALGELVNIQTDYVPAGGGPECTNFAQLIDNMIERATSAILNETGFEYDGRGSLVGTSEGSQIKIKTEYNNRGILSYNIGNIRVTSLSGRFEIPVDGNVFAIGPCGVIKRDYALKIPDGFESASESEVFYLEGDLIFRDRYMTFKYELIAPGKSPIQMSFIPSFRIIRPFAGDRIDRLVEMTQLKLIIEKPRSFSGDVTLEFVTPPGVHIGAYQKDISLKDGDRSYEINLPIAIGKSAGNRKLKVIASLKQGEKTIGWDQANILGLETRIEETAKIALVSGAEGLLEDILRMTGVGYSTISDRYLETGYLGLYDIILIDSDCFGRHPSLGKLSDKLKRFVEFGGSIIVFGQSDKWPGESLPVSITPKIGKLDSRDVGLSGSANDPLFTKTYQTSPTYLINKIQDSYRSYPAQVFPSESILNAGPDRTLLSRTKIGSGQIIYCGFPVLDMFADLEPLAVKFFVNMINFSLK